MLDWLLGLIDEAQGAIFEHVLQPALYQLGLMDWSDELFDGVGFALFGALEIVLAYILLRPLEWWRPVERWSDRRAVRTDVVYSLVNRLGVVPAILFLLLTPIAAMIEGTLRFQGFIPADAGAADPAAARAGRSSRFLLYIVVIDFAEYWRHRLQHRLPWWWALHSLHHDQRQMTLWADDRNHVLDDVLTSVWRGTIALLIGVAPAEFPLVMIAFRLVENLSHTNVRFRFGRLGTALAGRAAIPPAAPFDRARAARRSTARWDAISR